MVAYVIAQVEVVDDAGYEEYRQKIAGTIAAYGGRSIVRGGVTEVLEGQAPGQWVVLEFPSMERLKAWYASPEYRPLRAVRARTATSLLVAADGV
ncbi:MAG: DUF1330 domain-containing protein [Burkholderiaceae bacterium]|nr:MAG: DUF1330 domain-containing protein [Burkholderiaceae bacterium]